jgi:hypothetical protein
MTIAPYGPDVTLNTGKAGWVEVVFLGGTYTFDSKADLLAQAEKLPFTVEVIALWPGLPQEEPQIKVGDAEKDKGYWRCSCGTLNNHGVFAGPYHCFGCGRAEPTEQVTFVPVEAGTEPRMSNPEAEFLRDLSERLLEVPVKYGVDQGDIDHLRSIADALDS